MRKYKIDRRYPSQYGFYNRARSRQIAENLSPCQNAREPACSEHAWQFNFNKDWTASFSDQSLFWYSRSTMAWPITEPTPPLSKLQLFVMRTDKSFYLYTIVARCLLANLCGRSPIWSIYIWEVSSALVSICVVSTCRGMRFIIFKRHLVIKSELSVGCNQTSSLVKSSASSLVLVKVYWLDNKGSSLVCHWY